MGTENTRHTKVEWIKSRARKVQEEGLVLDTDKLFARFAFECNSTEVKGKEIFQMLLRAGEI